MEEYRFKASTIATKGGKLTIGGTYQFKEGSYIRDIQLQNIIETESEWQFNIFIKQEESEATVSFVKRSENTAFHGIWKIVDAGTYDVEKAIAYRKKLEEKVDNAMFTKLHIDLDEFDQPQKKGDTHDSDHKSGKESS